MNKNFKRFENASPFTKVIVVVVIIIILYFVWSFYQQGKNKVKNTAQVLALQAEGVTASFSPAKYNSLANTLETAMSGWGTDEQAIFNVFSQLINDLDFIKLDSAFGIRESEDMVGWLKGDLSSSDIGKINQQLSNKGLSNSI